MNPDIVAFIEHARSKGMFAGPRDDDVAPFWNHPAGRHCFKFDVLKPK